MSQCERIYDITPMGKPRMTQRDKWLKRPETDRYWAFKDECRLKRVELPEAGAHVTFVLPMPKHWSPKKRREMDGQPHREKPDIDNLMKALMDALFDDDSRVHDIRASKVWGWAGCIKIEYPVEEIAA